MKPRNGIMIDQQTMPMSEVNGLLTLYGFSPEFWMALKQKVRARGFQYSRGRDKTEECCFYVQGDKLVHELWMTDGRNT